MENNEHARVRIGKREWQPMLLINSSLLQSHVGSGFQIPVFFQKYIRELKDLYNFYLYYSNKYVDIVILEI